MIDVGVDVGGTFTDFTFFDRDSGDHWVKKVPSTPSDIAEAVLEGLKEVDLSQVGNIVHGTTVALNSVIQRVGAKTALLTTPGFRDHIEIGDTLRYTGGLYDHQWVRTPPYPVPHSQRFEVQERTSGDGKVEVSVSEENIKEVAQTLQDLEIEAVSICFLNSYLNPENEKKAGELLAKLMPNCAISLSSINPEFREYPRFITSVFNAFIAPSLAQYLNRLESSLAELGYSRDVLYMTSAGGITSGKGILEEPLRLLFGAVAGGVSAGAFLANLGEMPNVVTFDMGGTSTDVGFVEDYEPQTVASKVLVAFPIALPHLDVRSIGAGGGSIALVDEEGGSKTDAIHGTSAPVVGTSGTIRVGPESAGAEPGPACYGKGGEEFTVTDANLLLGRLGESSLLSGELLLDKSLAEKAARKLAEKVGIEDIYELASGVIDLANTNMYGAIREVSIERGSDPADLTLIAFGGAGGLHAVALAERLEMARVLVPKNAGIFSALGMLAADRRRDFVRSYLRPLPVVDFAEVESEFLRLGEAGLAALQEEGIAESEIKIEYRFGMRYEGQIYEEEVVLESPKTDFDGLSAAFGEIYEGKYGFRREPELAELVNLRVVAIGETVKPDLELAHKSSDSETKDDGDTSTRGLYVEGEFVDCPVHRRQSLDANHSILGPAIVEEYDSTTVVPPGWSATVDNAGSLIMERLEK